MTMGFYRFVKCAGKIDNETSYQFGLILSSYRFKRGSVGEDGLYRMPPFCGYVALVTVLVIGAISLAIAAGMSVRSLDVTKGVTGGEQGAVSLYLATACAEEALRRIFLSAGYRGNEIYVFPTGSCSVLTVSRSGSIYTFRTESVNPESVSKLRLQARRTIGGMQILIWEALP